MTTINLTNLLAGDSRTLSKAITLIESRAHKDKEPALNLLQQLPEKAQTQRIAISGPPGAGKSTLIDVLGMKYLEQGHKVAVLAVDPSSPLRGGSILADKTRMQKLSRASNTFIRPSACGAGYLGGLNPATPDVIRVVETAGYDVILLESIGVGQNEVAACLTTDLMVLVLSPAAGDELQGLKKGIVEMADCIIINKADGPLQTLALRMAADYRSALSGPQSRPILICSAQNNEGITEVRDCLRQLIDTRRQKGTFFEQREKQKKAQLKAYTLEIIEEHFSKKLQEHSVDLSSNNSIRQSSYLLAEQLMKIPL